MEIPKHIYHGTCRAFMVYALQNGGKFGPDYDSVSFTPQIGHARMFAESWRTPAGKKRLEDYFGQKLKDEFFEPIILEFDSSMFEKLKYREDAGADEFYVKKGPVDIFSAKEISYQ